MSASEVELFNPFPGLRPFETDEYHLFFGREGQSDELMARLQRTRFLAVVGTSGSGKSSLIRAGLLPSLYGGLMAGVGSGWRVCVMRPGHDPVGNLACALSEEGVLGGGGQDGELQQALIEATLRRSTLGLVDTTRQARLDAHENLLVVVDQFEELFRFRSLREARGGGDDAAAFVKLLLEASAQREVPVYVVLTMRSDFLGDCAQFWGLPEAINEGQYLIPRMTRDERREAITGPVAVGGGEITPSLVNRLLNDMGDSPDQLPILQHALMRTWDEWAGMSPEHRARHRGQAIDLCCYEAIGGMADALSRHADEAWGELRDDRERGIAEKMFKALAERVSEDREVRRPTRLREICGAAEASQDEVAAVIEVFRREGRSFLMPPAGVELEPDTVIDVSHESLIRNWQRLKKWTAEEAQSARFYARLADAAAMRDEGQGGYLADPTLQLMLDWREQARPNAAWAARYRHDFSRVMAFLDESREHRDALAAREQERQRREIEQTRAFAEQQARTNRKLRLMTAAMALLLVLALGAAGYAVAKRNEAHANEAEAVRLAGLARLSEQEALKRRDELADALKARDAADEAKEAAQAAEARAQMAKDEALSRAIKNEARAKKEAERANEQAELAAKNLRQANEAAEAEKIARVKLQSSLERNRWSRDGLAAYQRGDYDSALGAFMIVRDSTAAEGGDRGGQVEDVETARVHGWAHAYVGATLRQLRQPAQAVESYERALPILEEVLDPDDPVRFDTYHGMAHAYREAYKTDAAEEFYNRALKFLEERTPTAPTAGGMSGPVAAKMAATLENVARLYRDLGRYDDAEPVYKRIVKLREPSGGPEFVASLKEMAQFYLGQNKYREAEALFPKMLDTQERRFIGGEGGEGDGISNFRELGDSYSELGEVYVGLGEESKAQEAFQLARAVQDYWIKARQVLRQSGGVADAGLMRAKFKEVGGEKNLAEMARLLVRLGRYKAAEGIYLELIRFYDNENEDAESAAANVALGNLYRDHLNDPEKAEEHYKVAEEAASRQGDVRPTLRRASAVLAEALRQRAALYASRPEKFSEALSLYERAHKIYEQRDSWLGENAALYGIIQMVEKQKRPVEERTLAYRRRFDALGKYVRKFGCEGCERPNDFFGIVFEYARAANDAAYVYGLARKQDDAEAVFRSVFEAWGTIKLSTFSPKALDAYARTLDSYQALLTRRGKPAEAAKVAELAKSVREKQSQFQQASEQQQLQQKYAQQQAAP